MKRSFCAVALGFLALSAGSCTRSYTSWHHAAGDAESSNAVSVAIPSTFRHTKTVRIDLPDNGEADAAVYLGDIQGTGGPEIVVVSTDRIEGYTLSGRDLFAVSVPNSPIAPGFLHDFDNDGKQDIIIGTRNAPMAGFLVYNGFGALIFEHTFTRETGNYLAIEPEFASGGALYLLAQESWPRNPRSIIKFSLALEREEWEFYLPSRPIGLAPFRLETGGAGIMISQQTVGGGEFTHFGLKGEVTFGFDSKLHLLVVHGDGSLERLLPVTHGAGELDGRGLFYPTGAPERSVLLFVEPGSLFLLDSETGTVKGSAADDGESVIDMRTLDKGASYMVLLSSGHGLILKVFDRSMTLIRKNILRGAGAVLGPVFPAAGEASSFVLLAFDDGLYAVTASLEPRFIAEVSSPDTISATVVGSKACIVAVGKTLEIVTLTW